MDISPDIANEPLSPGYIWMQDGYGLGIIMTSNISLGLAGSTKETNKQTKVMNILRRYVTSRTYASVL